MKYVLIHVNKCAGGTIFQALKEAEVDVDQIHTERTFDKFDPYINDPDVRFIYMVRDPVARFVSSFNFVRKIFRKFLIRKRMKGYFNMEYEVVPDFNEVMEKFNTSNHFKARFLQWCLHIDSGFDYYFNHVPDFIQKIKDRTVFVGTVENIVDDYAKLAAIIKTDTGKELGPLKHVHNSVKDNKPVSKEAVDTMREYSVKEYAVLQTMVNEGLLDQSYIDKIMARTEYTY